MSNVIILYDSKTGLTELMAETIAQGVREVDGVEIEIFKAGTPFSISKLNGADAIVVGSPSHYGRVTENMRELLESIKMLEKTNKLNLSNKSGGIFTSYAWDRNLLSESLESELRSLGIRIVEPIISTVDKMGGWMSSKEKLTSIVQNRIDEETIKRCRQLGRKIAKSITNQQSL